MFYLILLSSLALFINMVSSGQCPCKFPLNNEEENKRIDEFLSSDKRLNLCGSEATMHLLNIKKDQPIWNHNYLHAIKIDSSWNSREILENNCQVYINVTSTSDSLLRHNERQIEFPLHFPLQCPQICDQHLPHVLISSEQIHALMRCSILASAEDCLKTYPTLHYLGCTIDFKRNIWLPWRQLATSHSTSSVPGRIRKGLLNFAISHLVWRRWLECSEYLVTRTISAPFTSNVSQYHNITETKQAILMNHQNFRRPVFLVIVWIGSVSKFSVIQQQMSMFYHLPKSTSAFPTANVILPWAATDEIYPCRNRSTKCLVTNKRYRGFLTQSAVNFMPSGWRCAQRRPLRSLSHILSLVEPKYLVLLDDDSAFNLPLFLNHTLPYLEDKVPGFQDEPVVLGELLGRIGDHGHLSKLSMFVGGSGYVFNNLALERLHSRSVGLHHGQALKQTLRKYGNEFLSPLIDVAETLIQNDLVQRESIIGSKEHWNLLSILGDGIEAINVAENVERCSACMRYEPSNTNNSITDSKFSVNLSVRLVDFCANLMANEHTCQHSDHSMGRCILYGIQALPINAVCMDHTVYDNTSTLSKVAHPRQGFWYSNLYLKHGLVDRISGMCFSTPQCDPKKQLVCHRYIYEFNGDDAGVLPSWSAKTIWPTSNPKNRGYYKAHTSIRNGSFYDT